MTGIEVDLPTRTVRVEPGAINADVDNAAEDLQRMGDHSAGALFIAQSDAPGQAKAHEIELMARVCEEHGAGEVFTTDDPEEGEMLTAARRAARHEVEIPVVAHAGDGNTHPITSTTPLTRGRPRARVAFAEVMALAISLGGTITGEHGVGRLKKQALTAQLGEEVMDVSRAIKAALDPLGLLDPGAVL